MKELRDLKDLTIHDAMFAGWGLERGRENIAKRIPTPLLSAPLPFAPTAIVPLPEGRSRPVDDFYWIPIKSRHPQAQGPSRTCNESKEEEEEEETSWVLQSGI